MRAGAKQVTSQHQPRKFARRRVLKLAINLPESRGENSVTDKSASRGKGTRGSLWGWTRRPSQKGRARPPVPALYLRLPSARGRRLGCLSGRPAPGSRHPMSPGRSPALDSLVAPTRFQALGPAAGARGRSLAARGDRDASLSAAGCAASRRGPDCLFRSPHGRRRLLPDAPVGGGSPEEQDVPVRPGLEVPAPKRLRRWR